MIWRDKSGVALCTTFLRVCRIDPHIREFTHKLWICRDNQTITEWGAFYSKIALDRHVCPSLPNVPEHSIASITPRQHTPRSTTRLSEISMSLIIFKTPFSVATPFTTNPLKMTPAVIISTPLALATIRAFLSKDENRYPLFKQTTTLSNSPFPILACFALIFKYSLYSSSETVISSAIANTSLGYSYPYSRGVKSSS